MYSVVLMAALSTASNEPAGCWARHGCCSSTVSYGCSSCRGFGGGWCYGGYNGYGSYGGCYATYGCYGGGYGSYGYGCHGCYGASGCYGGGNRCTGTMQVLPTTPVRPGPGTVPTPKPSEKKPEAESSVAPNRAHLIVEVPADAKLYVDDHLMKSTSVRRNFHTPELEQGPRYFYDVRVELLREGKTVMQTKRVVLKAGQEVAVSFTNLAETSTLTADAAK